jgi:hypothetical protein
MVIFLSLNQRDLNMMKNIMSVFNGASGRGCNVHKCELAPIRYDDTQIQLALKLSPAD